MTVAAMQAANVHACITIAESGDFAASISAAKNPAIKIAGKIARSSRIGLLVAAVCIAPLFGPLCLRCALLLFDESEGLRAIGLPSASQWLRLCFANSGNAHDSPASNSIFYGGFSG